MSEKLPKSYSPDPSSQRRSSRWEPIALILLPLLLFVGIGWFAPNYVPSDKAREATLGGDFLQEYVGGILYRDPSQNKELYNIDVCRALQHNEELVGFTWDDSKFFPMVYPPFYYAIVSPLSKLEYLTAARVWLFLMIAALIAALFIIRRVTRLHVGLVLASCLAAPLLLSLTTGQKSSVLLLILAATFWAYRENKKFLAGAVFGLIAFKPHLGVPIGLFMLARKEYSFVMGCYFSVFSLIVVSIFTGFDVCTDYFSVVMGFSEYVQTSGYHLEKGFSIWSAVQMGVSDPTVAKVATVVSSLAVLGGTAWILRKPERMQGDEALRSFSAMVMATVLVAPHLYGYDLTMLILPALLLTQFYLNQKRAGAKSNLIAPALLVVVLVGMDACSWLALHSGIQLGVVLLVASWFLALQPFKYEGMPVENSAVTQKLAGVKA